MGTMYAVCDVAIGSMSSTWSLSIRTSVIHPSRARDQAMRWAGASGVFQLPEPMRPQWPIPSLVRVSQLTLYRSGRSNRWPVSWAMSPMASGSLSTQPSSPPWPPWMM